MDAIGLREEQIADRLIKDIPDLDVNSNVSGDEGELQPYNGKVDMRLDLSSNSRHNIVRYVIKPNKEEKLEHENVIGIDQVSSVPPQWNHTHDRPSSSHTNSVVICKINL